MVFMQGRNEGRPVAAILLLSSMFAFAFVFHAVTRPDAVLPSQYDLQLAAFAAAAPNISARDTIPFAAAARVAPVAPARPAAVVAPAAPDATDPPAAPESVLNAVAWSRPIQLPSSIAPTLPVAPLPQAGAVSRAFASAGTALRSALKKAF
jgi:hypothetical protein